MTSTSKIAAAVAAALVAVLGLAGCGSGGGTSADGSGSTSPVATATVSPSATPSTSAAPSTGSDGGSSASVPATITIRNFAYKTSGTVKAGSTVMITNDDTEAHTVTADTAGGFDVKILPGKTATLTAPAKGSYRYHCTYHSDMHGTLIVR